MHIQIYINIIKDLELLNCILQTGVVTQVYARHCARSWGFQMNKRTFNLCESFSTFVGKKQRKKESIDSLPFTCKDIGGPQESVTSHI